VTVGPNGKVQADIEAREIVIDGRVEGNLKASESAHFGASSRVSGSVLTPRIGSMTARDCGARWKRHPRVPRAGLLRPLKGVSLPTSNQYLPAQQKASKANHELVGKTPPACRASGNRRSGCEARSDSVCSSVRQSPHLKWPEGFLWLISDVPHGRVLDLGPVWQSTVSFFVDKGYRVSTEDLLRTWKDFLALRKRAFARRLSAPMRSEFRLPCSPINFSKTHCNIRNVASMECSPGPAGLFRSGGCTSPDGTPVTRASSRWRHAGDVFTVVPQSVFIAIASWTARRWNCWQLRPLRFIPTFFRIEKSSACLANSGLRRLSSAATRSAKAFSSSSHFPRCYPQTRIRSHDNQISVVYICLSGVLGLRGWVGLYAWRSLSLPAVRGENGTFSS